MKFNFLKRGKKALAISTSSLGFSYKKQEVLKDFNLNVKESSITAIIGKSGSGKSTFLKLVSGVISKKYSGKIRILGLWKLFSKKKIGFVPQENSFIHDLSLADNIKIIGMNFGISEQKALTKAKKLMTLLKFEEDLSKKPQELSGGQKVRLNIILSLLHEPEVVILDEPFVGLDFKNRKLLWHFIQNLKKKKKSVILTSHLLSEVEEHVDKVVILQKGKVFFNGKIDSLKNKLKISHIFEVKFSRLSKENFEKIRKYCIYKDIKILDTYENYIMFSLNSDSTKNTLVKLFNRFKLKFEIIGFREPNLDEIFLKTENV